MTPFARRVYKVVLSVPLGEVRTYKWVAKKIGNSRAYRAVGQALKKNPWPLLIPCHRIINSSGDLGGYVWGRKNKKAILDLERQLRKLML